jgi:hypothetical protein
MVWVLVRVLQMFVGYIISLDPFMYLKNCLWKGQNQPNMLPVDIICGFQMDLLLVRVLLMLVVGSIISLYASVEL